ncbi:capsular polysaccharide biosynthesis protein [Streptomyces puniciscabiei]|uniref:Capsular polysaccharide biosynthesis protein n=1 Tax=Streptomyces puniciscabiei TaxID=164348 RepID=A0A542UIQ2_9ACTN|nr:hypothetical protein [Streptomyces puniciscabiei]TQK98936.1 capsular polysaccharide biosynthesis protein [Streptomyces puniciscabiei]
MTGPIPFDDRFDQPEQLRDQLRLLMRHRVAMALGVALGLLGGLAAAWYCAGTYSATSDVLVRAGADPFDTVSLPVDNQISMVTEQQIATSAAVAVRAAHTLAQPESRVAALQDHLRVTNPGKSQVLHFEFTAGSPGQAARGANAFAEAYLADRRSRNDAAVRRAVDGVNQQITALARQPRRDTDNAGGEIDTLRRRAAEISARDTDGGDVVRRAVAPSRPAGPGARVLAVLGLAGGAVLGVLLAWLCSALDSRVRSAREVEAALGAPVLATLPHDGAGDAVLTVGRTDGARTRAYRSLAVRTGLSAGSDRLLVVAPRAGDSAGAVAANLAAAFAECGREVVLVEADPDTPGLAAGLPLVPEEERTGQETSLPEGAVLVDAGRAGRFVLRPGGGNGRPPHTDVPEATDRTASDTCSPITVIAGGSLLEHPSALAATAQRSGGVLVVTGCDTRREDLRQVGELISCFGARLLGAVVDAGRARRGAAVLRRTKPGPGPEGVLPGAQPAGQHDTLTASRG